MVVYRTLLAFLLLAATLTASKPLPIDSINALNASTAAPVQSSLAASLLASWTPPLSTRGRYIVDAHGIRFPLRSGNWHGASGTYLGRGSYSDPLNHHAGEVAWQTPLCLDRASLDDIIRSFLELGLNSIRLPFSNEMLRVQSIVPDSALRANPQLWGLTPLQIFDAVVETLTKAGFAVLLNNHTVRSRWCCGLDSNARWNGAQTDAQWQRDWLFIVRRYAKNPRVVGAELYNEVRRDVVQDPNWGEGGATDWFKASLDAANRIQREASSQVLIIIDGINFVGIPSPYTTHYRPELSPAATLSHALSTPNKLVYSSHFYAYTGPNATGSGGPFDTRDPTYADLSPAVLNATFNRLAGFLATDSAHHYTAPLWISEFGMGQNETSPKRRRWWGRFTGLLNDADVEWAYWPLVGWRETRDDPETEKDGGWSLVSWDSNGVRETIADSSAAKDWRRKAWLALLASNERAKRGYVEPQATWNMLSMDVSDAEQSATLASRIDWQPGSRRASCPDGLRLLGLSHAARPRSLCSDAELGRGLWSPGLQGVETVTDDRYVRHEWASGRAKFQCPDASFAIGFAVADDGRAASLICARMDEKTRRERVGTRLEERSVVFDRQDQLPSERGQWKRAEQTAGACADHELLVGFAFAEAGAQRWPSVLLCRSYTHDAQRAPWYWHRLGMLSFSDGAKSTMLNVWTALRNTIMLL